MQSGPRPALEMPEAKLALELLVRLLAHLVGPDRRRQCAQQHAGRQVVVVELALAGGPPLASHPATLPRPADDGYCPTPRRLPPGRATQRTGQPSQRREFEGQSWKTNALN